MNSRTIALFVKAGKLPRISAILLILLAVSTLTGFSTHGIAQSVTIPNFWDKHERFPKPDLSKLPRLRFLTTTDFPPFNYIDRKKRLSGFHVDLARAICSELDLLNRCQIQALPWDELEKSIVAGEGDAIIAGLVLDKKNLRKYDFSRPYMHIPGRFVSRKDSGLTPPIYEALFKKTIGVVGGSAHQAYFSNAFGERKFEVFETRDAALKALIEGKVQAVFSDGLSLSFWLASSASQDCCVFVDGAYMSEEYFGHGLAVTLPKDRDDLVQGINYALKEINDNGTFAELYLRYFPVGLF